MTRCLGAQPYEPFGETQIVVGAGHSRGQYMGERDQSSDIYHYRARPEAVGNVGAGNGGQGATASLAFLAFPATWNWNRVTSWLRHLDQRLAGRPWRSPRTPEWRRQV